MAEIDGELFAPNTKVSDIEYGEVSWQGEYHGFAVVPSEGYFFAVFVRDPDSLRGWFRTLARPEFSI